MKPGLAGRIAAELRTLRKLPGTFTDTKLVQAPMLLKGFGGGNPEAALSRLCLIQAEHREDSAIAAAFASIGLGTEGETVLDRLTDYGATRYVDARTVRRWSDAGIEKLAALLLSEAPWFNPKIGLQVEVATDQLICRVEFVMPRNLGMRRPQLNANDASFDLMYKRTSELDADRTRFKCEAVYVPLLPPTRVQIDLDWRGEIRPSYVFETRGMGDWRTHCRLTLEHLRVLVTHPDELQIREPVA